VNPRAIAAALLVAVVASGGAIIAADGDPLPAKRAPTGETQIVSDPSPEDCAELELAGGDYGGPFSAQLGRSLAALREAGAITTWHTLSGLQAGKGKAGTCRVVVWLSPEQGDAARESDKVRAQLEKLVPLAGVVDVPAELAGGAKSSDFTVDVDLSTANDVR